MDIDLVDIGNGGDWVLRTKDRSSHIEGDPQGADSLLDRLQEVEVRDHNGGDQRYLIGSEWV
jgi:hypothetical protein